MFIEDILTAMEKIQNQNYNLLVEIGCFNKEGKTIKYH